VTGERDNPPVPTPPGDDLWTRMRRLTAARIGLAYSGASLAIGPLLDFRLAHARARDAVQATLDIERLTDDLAPLDMPLLTTASAAADKQTYLMRPDLGRTFAPAAEAALAMHAGTFDVVFVISDGLSARAVQFHAPALLALAAAELKAEGWCIAPVVIAVRGRVAIGDSIAALLGAQSVAVLIGERPGLSAPDSMGAYLTWQPGVQTSNAERNCISNIRPGGITCADAAFKLVQLMRTMRARGLSGVSLKDETDRLAITATPFPASPDA
jgi:ethanolamine ammonia-lyase small subunit